MAMPTIINLSGVSPVNENNFSADYNIFDDGSARIVFYTIQAGVPVGSEEILLNLHFNGEDVLSALVVLRLMI